MPLSANASLSPWTESTEDLIWSVDLKNRITFFNSALKHYFKSCFDVDLVEGICAKDVVPFNRAHLLPALYKRALSKGSFRTEFLLADSRTLELSLHPIIIEGQATGISVFGKDITGLKKANQDLVESEGRFRAIFEENGSVMFLVDPSTSNIADANSAVCALLWISH